MPRFSILSINFKTLTFSHSKKKILTKLYEGQKSLGIVNESFHYTQTFIYIKSKKNIHRSKNILYMFNNAFDHKINTILRI